MKEKRTRTEKKIWNDQKRLNIEHFFDETTSPFSLSFFNSRLFFSDSVGVIGSKGRPRHFVTTCTKETLKNYLDLDRGL